MNVPALAVAPEVEVGEFGAGRLDRQTVGGAGNHTRYLDVENVEYIEEDREETKR